MEAWKYPNETKRKTFRDSPHVLQLISFLVSVSQENLLRLVNIEYSVRGQQDLLQPGRVMSAITALFALPTLSAVHRPSAALYTIIQLGIPSPVRSQQQRSLPLKASRACVCVCHDLWVFPCDF